MSLLIKENALENLSKDTIGNIILNKLVKSIKNTKKEKEEDKKRHIPLSLTNIRPFNFLKVEKKE